MDSVLLYRPEEAAAKLGISRSKCYELIARGVIPHLRLDRSLRVPAAELRHWVTNRTEASVLEEHDEGGEPRTIRRW
jgi:excisionase family DNA binding protein